MKSPLEGSVLLSQRVDLKLVVREEVKAMGVANNSSVSTIDELEETLKKAANYLIIIDWELGSVDAVKAMQAIRGNDLTKQNPIFLIANVATKTIVSTALEYGVIQTHIGRVTQNSVRDALRETVKIETAFQPLKSILKKVVDARNNEQWGDAISMLTSLLAKAPNNPKVICELAETYIQMGDLDNAIGLLNPLTEAETPYVRALHLIGRCYLKKSLFQEASIFLDMAKTLSPHNVERLIELGHSLLHLDHVKEAKENFDEASTLDPKNAKAKQGVGQCLLMSGEINEGLELINDVSSPQELASIFNVSAVLAMQAGRHQQGMALYESAMNAIKGNRVLESRLMYNKGLGFKRQNDFKSSMECFKKSIELDATFDKVKVSAKKLAQDQKIELPEVFTKQSASVKPKAEQAKMQKPVQPSSTIETQPPAIILETEYDFGFGEELFEDEEANIDKEILAG